MKQRSRITHAPKDLDDLRLLFQQIKRELEKLPGVQVSIAISIQMTEPQEPETPPE